MRSSTLRRSRIPRLLRARWLAVAVILGLAPVLSAATVTPSAGVQAGVLAVVRPKLPGPGKPVPVHVVASRHVKVPRTPKSWHHAPARWPAAGSAVARVKAASAQPGAGSRAGQALARPTAGSVRAGSLPLWVGPSRAGGKAATVTATMSATSAARAAGVQGVLFSLSSASQSAAPVHVTLNYSSFAQADGASFGSRLKLVELPACALTTPKVAACRRQTPLASANDPASSQVGADVTVPAPATTAAQPAAGAAAGGAQLTSDVVPAAAGQARMVVAAVASASGSEGDFSATPLSEAGSWQEGGASGGFDYSYPVSVPPVPGGLQPTVSLDYDSQSLDGLTSSTNNQASWVGDGWDLDSGYVQRDYETCSQDALTPALPAADKTGDLCWSAASQTVLSVDGTNTTLVDDPSNGWHATADNGAQITYRSSATGNGTSNGTHDGGYWVVAEPDGTTYFFGLNELPGWQSGDKATNSAWTVPVYSPRSSDSDGCYNATFADSDCNQAWRWNLDYETDSNGDAEAWFYNTQTGYYGADNAVTGTAGYTRAGALASIWYGFRNGSLYSSAGSPAGAGEVAFTSVTTRTDVPTDLACSSGATCDVNSPSFWSGYQLTGITTYALDAGTMTKADSWALGQGFVNPGDDTATAPLTLESITRTGEDGTAISLPPVSFGYEPLVNRVENATDLSDGYTEIPRERIETVTSETGQVTAVAYDSPPAACASNSSTLPSPDDNTTLCYPDYWTPPGASAPIEDWFNKYVVTQVTEENTAGGDPDVVTSYCYGPAGGDCLSGGAWHYNDSALTRSAQRTWDQWRGFAEVTTTTGTAPDPVTQETGYYLQGMNGDEQSGGGTASKSVSVTVPGTSTTVTVPDDQQWQGTEVADVTYDGKGGAVVSDTVTTPWTSAATAAQAQPGGLPDLDAYLTGTARAQTFTALASGGYREADQTYGHDSLGRVVTEADVPDFQDNGAAGDASEDTCTQTSYASDSQVLNTGLTAEQVVTAGPPADCPASLPPSAGALVSDTVSLYDGMAQGTAGAGNLTASRLATSFTGSAENFTTESQASYDEYGRVVSATDADGNVTTTSYTPAAGAEPVSQTVTDPQGLVTTTTFDPVRELPLTVTSPYGGVTAETYDALGRLTQGWSPGHAEASDPATAKFSYSVSATAPSVVTTDEITGTGSYNVSETIYNSALQPVETQTETPDGGRDITDTVYNSDGSQSLVSSPYYAAGAPSSTLVEAQDTDIPSQTGYVYDGDGRVIRNIAYADGTETWETDTAYGGDYTTVTPPAGGTAQTTYVNGDGQTSYLYTYHSSPPPSAPPAPGSGPVAGAAGWDQTSYAYTPAAQLAGITDTAGNHWEDGWDLAGNQVSETTPDAGTTTSVFDADGNLLQTENAAGQTVSYAYDADSRKVAEYSGPVAAQSGSDEIASWLYDTIRPGLLTSSTSYVGGTAGAAYTQQVLGYFASGQPTGTETIIPAAAGGLAGTYKQGYAYNSYTGAQTSYEDLAAGGLPTETVSTGYDSSGNPTSLTSSLWPYVAQLSYTSIGQPQTYRMGPTTSPVYTADTYDPQTGNLDTTATQAGSVPVTVDDDVYHYNDAGQITAADDGGTGITPEDQCYAYNYAGELASAWSQDTTSCAATPSAGILGGAYPYWQQLTYDATGNVTEADTTTGAPGEPGAQTVTSQANTYPAAGTAGPHQLTSEQVTTGAGTTTASQSFNLAGQLTATSTGGTQTSALTWNSAGQLTADTTTAPGTGAISTAGYVYDADGTLLLQSDGSATTLYLGDEQITDADGSLSGTRYYTIGGTTVAARTSTGTISYLVGDQQGTSYLAIDADTLDATRRYDTPWGVSLQSDAPAFPGTRSFVGGTAGPATGLTNLGAREYNPELGQFISTDPILNPDDPLDLNPYAYASNNPVNSSDPTGLMPCIADGPCGSLQYLENWSNNQAKQAQQAAQKKVVTTPAPPAPKKVTNKGTAHAATTKPKTPTRVTSVPAPKLIPWVTPIGDPGLGILINVPAGRQSAWVTPVQYPGLGILVNPGAEQQPGVYFSKLTLRERFSHGALWGLLMLGSHSPSASNIDFPPDPIEFEWRGPIDEGSKPYTQQPPEPTPTPTNGDDGDDPDGEG